MDWKRFTFLFARNVVIGVVLATVVLGGLGFLLAGVPGMVNMAGWGVILGALGGFSSGLAVVISAHYWGAYAGRFGAAWLKKETEGEATENEPSETPGKDRTW
jgi:hypothetical protein